MSDEMKLEGEGDFTSNNTPSGNGGESKDVPATDIDKPAPTSEEQQRAEAVAGSDRKIKTLQDWMDAEENRPETAEQRKKRERMEKSKRIIAAVSDGISALSNLYFTSQYAPNMYNHEKSSITNAVDARIERVKAEREKKSDQYLNFALKLGDLENDRAKTLRELEAQQEARRIARDKAEQARKQFEFEQSLWPDRQREQAGKANKAEQDAITAKAIADYAPEMQMKKGAVEDARAESYKASAGASSASADASRAKADYYRNGGSDGTKKHHFRGKEYVSDKDYTKDVTDAALQYNERHKDEEGFVPIIIEREERSASGKRIVPRKPEEYAGEVERRLEEEAADNRPPSRRNDNTPPSRR